MIQGAGLVVVLALVAVVVTQIAVAVPVRPAPRPARTVDWSDVRPGSDASWPSCTPPRGTTRLLPLAESPAFAVVGINDGLPGTRSACIDRETAWADAATGGSGQPRLAYYVLAADPWTEPELKWVPHPPWPSSNTIGGAAVTVPAAFAGEDGTTACAGAHDDPACAYLYGWTIALADAALPGVRSPTDHRFWIDVEAERTWSDDRLFDQAVVEGMVAAFTAPRSAGGVGTTVGVYSDYSEWARIVGRLRTSSPVAGLDEWLAIGRSSEAEAVRALRRGWPFEPEGRVRIVQYLDGAVDRDVAAPAPR